MTPPARRGVVAAAMLALFAGAAAIFLLPFAFPTPPPIITAFRSTQLVSPNGDGARETAQISIRVRQPLRLTLEVRDSDDVIRRLIDDEPKGRGWIQERWDGRDAAGQRVADGDYSLRLRAESGSKNFRTSRRIVVDATRPVATRFVVRSAALAGPGPGECRAALATEESGSRVTFEVLRRASQEPLRTVGPRPIRAGKPQTWSWDATLAGGDPAPVGIYRVRATLADAARNRSARELTCWVGHIIGVAQGRAGRGERIGVRLSEVDGTPLVLDTPTVLAVHLRRATPGQTPGAPIGRRIGERVGGTIAAARVRLPRRYAPSQVWIVAQTALGRALIAPEGR